MITLADLLHIDILKDLSSGDLSALIPLLTEKTFPADTTIIHRGDPGQSMFMILDGKVVVTIQNDEGFEYTLSTLEEGDVFGEMALMTGEPRTADVKTITTARLLKLNQKDFFELVTANPALNENLLRMLVQRKSKTTVAVSAAQKLNIATLFTQPPPEIDQFIGKTNWTSVTNAKINLLATSSKNILIIGERGTGKDLAARLIHFRGPSKTETLLHLDCANPPVVQRAAWEESHDGQDILHREIAQESAIFGHGDNAGSYAKGIRRGYLELADNGSLILEDIDLLSLRTQRLLVQYIKEGVFIRAGETEQIVSKVRLFATTSKPLAKLEEEKKVNTELLKLVGAEILELKPLRERKKDISVIAEYFLQEYNQKFAKKVSSISKEALNLLVDHDWPLNVDELRQVVERAVAINTSNVIEENQVFLNIPTFHASGKYNLLRQPFIRELAERRFFPTGLRFITIPFILALILFTLAGPPENNPANLIVWAFWWPLLILSILFCGRSWCGYCPLPIISDGFNGLRKKFLPVPGFLSKNGIWIGMVGFAVILLSEYAAHMFVAAYATGILLLSILAGTVVTNFFFGKRAWCKHICPLGSMVSQVSTLSFIELKSNSTVCSSHCQTHDCVKDGNCPMNLHPSAAGVNKDCIFCLTCVKRCKHQAVRINARLPWDDLLARKTVDFAGAFFAVILVALILATKLPSWETFLPVLSWSFTDNLQIKNLATSFAIGLVFTVLVFFVSGFPKSLTWKHNFSVSGYAYLFLAFAGLFNIYFHEFAYHGHNLGPWIAGQTGLEDAVPAGWITPNLGTLKALIPALTLMGSVSSLLMLAKLAEKHSISPVVFRMHQGILSVTSLLFLLIL